MAERKTGSAESLLKTVGVLVTRPAHQAGNLARLIEREGGRAICIPAMEITGPADTGALQQIIDRLDEFHLVIFISPNAVSRAMETITSQRGGLPAHLTVACVGRGSARELARFGIDKPLTPAGRFDSEGLLGLPELTQVRGKNIVIFRGEGGRELLGDTLADRGASVAYAECYRRALPSSGDAVLQQALERGDIDIITITSVEGLHNLFELAGEQGGRRLADLPVVVVSRRQADACRELGLKTEPLVAGEASDKGILDAIRLWRER